LLRIHGTLVFGFKSIAKMHERVETSNVFPKSIIPMIICAGERGIDACTPAARRASCASQFRLPGSCRAGAARQRGF
jgi:hypothetical protein